MKKEIAKERIKVLKLTEETLKTLARIKIDSEIKERIESINKIARERIREINRLRGLI